LRDAEFVRFRCRVGHGWTGDALAAKQADVLDDALWTALRSLEENVSLSQQLARRNRDRGLDRVANRFERHAVAMETRAGIIRAAIIPASDIEPLEERTSARAAGD
jgi:two-component system, chemotaxis family, protein-glutamate methylesterase/glutaminase